MRDFETTYRAIARNQRIHEQHAVTLIRVRSVRYKKLDLAARWRAGILADEISGIVITGIDVQREFHTACTKFSTGARRYS
jgi:hypothetical protein